MANYTTTLKDVTNNSFLPETAIKMVFDDNNNSLSSSLTAADINVLEGGKINILSSSIASMSDYVTAEINDLSSVASGAASTAAWAASAATDAEGSLSGLNTAIASVASLASGNASDISALVTGKATKASSSANGNLAKFKADGDLEDTGIASTTIGQLQSGKADLSYVNGLKLTKVWENPNPSASTFEAQRVEVNGEVVEFLIYYRVASPDVNNGAGFFHGKCWTTSKTMIFGISHSGCTVYPQASIIRMGTTTRTLYVDIANNSTTFIFDDAKYFEINNTPTVSYGTENKYLVPLVIYKVGDIYNS